MSQQSIEKRDLTVQAKVGTIKTFSKEFEKHHHELMMHSKADAITQLIENFQQIVEITNKMDATLK